MLYAFLKCLHVIAAIVAVGINITYAIWIVRGNRQPESLRFALEGIKFLDDRIANPAYAVLLLSGLGMAYMGHIPLHTPWLALAMLLYFFMVAVGLLGYTPTLRQQIQALQNHGADSSAYRIKASRGHRLGAIIGVSVMIIIFLMVVKPQLG